MTWIEKTQGEDQDRDKRKPIERVSSTMVKALKHEELDETEQAKLEELGWSE